ncbi:MAG: 2-oxoacid:acceptor oxidoreductase subunit alpha [Bacteroidales bacterium]|nr:2-oxoacid:acceptor oxidoreductase subunit alpha [Bacteroidales bacterium]
MNGQKILKREDAVVKFVGDSGDGMQLSGTLFSDTSALDGNDIATFPDYPAEIRAPHNTIAGVSGFQVHIGSRIYSSGDKADVLICMNPASLKSNFKWARHGATIIVDTDTFTDDAIRKAGYESNPLDGEMLADYNVVKAPITQFTTQAVKDIFTDRKSAERCRNMFALGMIFFIFGKTTDHADQYLETKFKNKPDVIQANKTVIRAGYNYCENVDVQEVPLQQVEVAHAKMEKGKYRNITGNTATAWGLLAAAEKAGLPLYLGSYPITPATDIMVELAKRKSLNCRVFQAEDEIAGICSAIGASFAGNLACTSTSGPGLSLKSEALGLAVMTELPLVVIDVQRGGPSTGMPTKTEQGDLNQALFGRNGEAPCIIVAPSTSANCFDWAFEAARLALENMTPVILLSDAYLGNGSQLFKIPSLSDYPKINPPFAKENDPEYMPYKRDAQTLVRQWAIPGMEGLRHRIGGLEKTDGKGEVSTDNLNHEKMVTYRRDKVLRLADRLPLQTVDGDTQADLLVVGWGGTAGALRTAVEKVRNEYGKKIAYTHFNYISPLPKNTEEILRRYKKIVVCELNMGQFVNYLRMNYQGLIFRQYNKIQGLPFEVGELVDEFLKIIGE